VSPSPDYNLGRARGEITLVYDDKGATAAGRDLDTLEKKGGATTAQYKKASNAMIVGGVAIAAALALAVNAAANFEERLSAISAVSGATADEMDEIRKKALQLGKDTKFSAQDAALAMEELAKAGVPVEDILNGAADAAVALAAAGEIELPRAAEIASNAMNTFSLSAQQMPHVADIIAGAANASAISVDEFGTSLAQVGAAAALAGVSLDDTATAIALMGNAGIKGSDAGTSLKTMLLNLNPVTEKQIKLMKELGIVTEDGANQFFTAEGKAKSLADIAGVLQTALAGMTDQQKLATLETLFGSDAIRAAAVIAKEGAAGFEEMATAIGQTSAAEVAAKRMDNFKGSLEQLKGSLETAAIGIGSTLLPALRSLVDFINGLIGRFLELPESVQSFIAISAVVASSSLILIGVLGRLVIAFMALLPVIKAVSAALFANPIGLIVLALLALAVALVIAYQRSERFREIVDNAFQSVRATVEVVVALISAGMRALVSAFKSGESSGSGFLGFMSRLGVIARTAFEAIINAAQNMNNFFNNTLLPAIQKFGSILASYLGPVLAGIGRAFVAIGPPLFSFISAIAGLVAAIVGLAVPIFKLLINLLVTTLGPALRIAAQIFTGVLVPAIAAVAPVVGAFVGFIISTLGRFLATIFMVAAGVARFVTMVIKFFTDLFNRLVGGSIIPDMINGIIRWFAKLPVEVLRLVIKMVTGIIRLTLDLQAKMVSAVGNMISNVVSFFASLPGKAASAISGLPGRLLNIINTAMQNIGRAIANGVSNAVTVLSALPGRLAGAIAGLGGTLFRAGVNAMGQLADGLRSMVGKAVGVVTDAAKKIADLWPFSPAKAGPLRRHPMDKAGENLMKMLASGVRAKEDEVIDAVARVARMLPNLGTSIDLGSAGSASRTASRATTAQTPVSAPVHIDVDVDARDTGIDPYAIGQQTARRIGYGLNSGSFAPTVQAGSAA
jgi:TP901 family phage tail tape measure protein